MRKRILKALTGTIRENVNLNVNANTKPSGRLSINILITLFGEEIVNHTIEV